MVTSTTEPGTSRRLDRHRMSLWLVSVACIAGAAVVIGLLFWPTPRAQVTKTPPVSREQKAAEDVVAKYIRAADSRDLETVLAVVCYDPSGIIARDLEIIRSPSGYDVKARTHIDGFVRYTETQDGAQIDLMYRLEGITREGKDQAEVGSSNFFGDTYMLVRENGELKVCGGTS